MYLLDARAEIWHREIIVCSGVCLSPQSFRAPEELVCFHTWTQRVPDRIQSSGMRTVGLKDDVHMRNAQCDLDLLIDFKCPAGGVGFRHENQATFATQRHGWCDDALWRTDVITSIYSLLPSK